MMIDYDQIVARTQEVIVCEQTAFIRTKPHVLKACDVANRYLVKKPGDRVDVRFSSIFHQAIIEMYVDNIHAVTLIRTMIRQAGYVLCSKPVVKSQHDAVHEFKYAINPKGFLADILIEARVSGNEGATCRRVQVGTEQVPIYEIQCNSAEQPEPAPV